MRIGDEAFVGALGRADRAPDLYEATREKLGHRGALRPPDRPHPGQQGNEPPPGSETLGSPERGLVGREETVGWYVPHPSIPYGGHLCLSGASALGFLRIKGSAPKPV